MTRVSTLQRARLARPDEEVGRLQGLIAEVLAAWREAERTAAEHPYGWAHDRAVAAAARLRDLYQELTTDPETADSDAIRDALERVRMAERAAN